MTLQVAETYSNIPLLQTKMDIDDSEYLQPIEYGIVAIRIQALRANPVRGHYDLAHLQAIHRYLFRDFYDRAGTCVADIPDESDSALLAKVSNVTAIIKDNNYLRGMHKVPFVNALTEVYSRLNDIHPFGNDIAIREFIWQLAQSAGYTLDYSKTSRQRWHNATRQLLSGQWASMRKVFHAIILAERAVAFETLPCHQALAKHPELDGAYKMLIDARSARQNVKELQSDILKGLKTGCIVGDGVLSKESHHIISRAAAYRRLKILDTDVFHGQYTGDVIALSSHHILLQIDNTTAVCCARNNLEHEVYVGDRITTIQHENNRLFSFNI